MSLGQAMENAMRAMLVLGMLIGLVIGGLGWMTWWLIHNLHWSLV